MLTNKMRIFIALTIPSSEMSWIARNINERKTAYLPKLKWVAEINLHVTLKFLGEIEPDHVRFLQEHVPGVVSVIPKFNVSIGKIGVFPDTRRPKVIWMGMDGTEHLFGLQKEIDVLCTKIGQPKEKRPFSAHITLARVPEAATTEEFSRINRRIIENKEFPVRKTRVESVIIFKSELKPEGPVYTPIKISQFV